MHYTFMRMEVSHEISKNLPLMKMSHFTVTYPYNILLTIPSQSICGEQHCPGGHVTSDSEHVDPAGHPPLSIEHENSQYAVPVSSHTLQDDPVGHLKPTQAAMKRNKHLVNVTKTVII